MALVRGRVNALGETQIDPGVSSPVKLLHVGAGCATLGPQQDHMPEIALNVCADVVTHSKMG